MDMFWFCVKSVGTGVIVTTALLLTALWLIPGQNPALAALLGVGLGSIITTGAMLWFSR